jgi:hypothetical protein
MQTYVYFIFLIISLDIMDEHIFWDCKLYTNQMETMTDILCENSIKMYPKSVPELLRFVQGVCYCINKIPKFIL